MVPAAQLFLQQMAACCFAEMLQQVQLPQQAHALPEHHCPRCLTKDPGGHVCHTTAAAAVLPPAGSRQSVSLRWQCLAGLQCSQRCHVSCRVWLTITDASQMMMFSTVDAMLYGRSDRPLNCQLCSRGAPASTSSALRGMAPSGARHCRPMNARISWSSAVMVLSRLQHSSKPTSQRSTQVQVVKHQEARPPGCQYRQILAFGISVNAVGHRAPKP